MTNHMMNHFSEPPWDVAEVLLFAHPANKSTSIAPLHAPPVRQHDGSEIDPL
jgi:hypothetical protein